MKMDSGESYSLIKIFSGVNDKIVIPDLQRDYCWGNADCKLVSKFLDTIIGLDRSVEWPMGLIYGYADELYPKHIQLCDGQQRLTTLFLIVGVINRLLPDNKYQHVLISDFELNQDDQEPYLQYAIRESSLYFLSELTYHYFLGFGKTVITSADQIPNQPWYLSIYEQDPSVRSILSAVKLIEDRLSQRDDLEELGNFIVNDMEFMFYDMEGRANGEETFVVINTTGESLSANQNLKPKMINEYMDKKTDIAQKWEEMETWFWQKRNREEKHTSDEGMMEFLHCLMVLIKYQAKGNIEFVKDNEEFPYKSLDFERLYQYFEAYQKMYLFDYSERIDKSPRYPYSQENLFVILPTLFYCHRYPNADQDDVKRVYHLFSNLSRYVDLSRPAEPIAKAMKIVEGMDDKDVLCLKDKSELREEERKKLSLIATAGGERTDMELLFAQAESNRIFNGQISILLQWSNNDMTRLKYYLERVNNLWCGDNDKEDILRCALLTRGLKDYPLSLSNKSHLALGWKYKEWYEIFDKNTDGIKAFLDEKQSLQEMITNYSDTKSLYYTIIKDAKILGMSKYKYIRLGDNNIIIVLEKERSNADYLIIFDGRKYPKKGFLPKGWNYLWDYQGLLYTDHIKYDLTIDYIYKQGKGYQILLWSGKDKNNRKTVFSNLSAIQSLGLHQHSKGEECWATDYITDGDKAQEKLIEIAEWVDE